MKQKFFPWLGGSRGRKIKQVTPTPSSRLAPPEQYPEFPPATPRKLLDRRADFEKILSKRRFVVPRGETSDMPLFALYRLYEHLVLNHNIDLRNELERFWTNRWPVSDIPDPLDSAEPERYAVLSCILPLLVESFNKRIEVGLHRDAPAIINDDQIEEMWAREKVYEKTPEWTSRVPPLEETLVIPHEGGAVLDGFDDVRTSKQLKEKNILHWQPHIHFM